MENCQKIYAYLIPGYRSFSPPKKHETTPGIGSQTLVSMYPHPCTVSLLCARNACTIPTTPLPPPKTKKTMSQDLRLLSTSYAFCPSPSSYANWVPHSSHPASGPQAGLLRLLNPHGRIMWGPNFKKKNKQLLTVVCCTPLPKYKRPTT